MEHMTSLANRFRVALAAFEAGPAPLYAHLAGKAARELERPGRFHEALAPFEEEPARRLLPLRLFGLVHRWVLAGELRELAMYYPSVNGRFAPEGSWPLFRDAVIAHGAELPELLAPPHQHNEVARAAALAGGMLLVSRETGLPMRLLEVGASAGLLLRWDHYLRNSWFPSMFIGQPPTVEGPVVIQERRGCDLNPIDPTTAEGALLLRSLVWADLVEHLRILNDALQLAHNVPATIDAEDGAFWLLKYGMPRSGAVTVIYHSLMEHAGPPESLGLIKVAIEAAAERATPEAPLAYLRFEAAGNAGAPPVDARELVHLRLTTWPGGADEWLATADVNGRNVRWLQEATA